MKSLFPSKHKSGGAEHTDILYSRYHSLRNKNNAAIIIFSTIIILLIMGAIIYVVQHLIMLLVEYENRSHLSIFEIYKNSRFLADSSS